MTICQSKLDLYLQIQDSRSKMMDISTASNKGNLYFDRTNLLQITKAALLMFLSNLRAALLFNLSRIREIVEVIQKNLHLVYI
jgi:hypothetical protein